MTRERSSSARTDTSGATASCTTAITPMNSAVHTNSGSSTRAERRPVSTMAMNSLWRCSRVTVSSAAMSITKGTTCR